MLHYCLEYKFGNSGAIGRAERRKAVVASGDSGR